MRWKVRGYGLNERIVKGFALFPRRCKDGWRWLETYYMLQKRVEHGFLWLDWRWATKEEYIAWREETKDKEAT